MLAFARFSRDSIGKIRDKQSAIALCAQIYGERTLDPCRVGLTQPPIWDAEKLQLYSPELLIPLVGHFHFLVNDEVPHLYFPTLTLLNLPKRRGKRKHQRHDVH